METSEENLHIDIRAKELKGCTDVTVKLIISSILVTD